MAPFPFQWFVLALLTAAGHASAGDSGGVCECAAACAKLVADLRHEIHRLKAEARGLSADSPRVPAAAEVQSTAAPSLADRCSGDQVLASNADVEAFRGCSSAGVLKIKGNVTSLAGLQSLQIAVGVDISVDRSELTTLQGLENLKDVMWLSMKGNQRLLSLSGLDGLETAGSITVDDNAELESLAGLAHLKEVGQLTVKQNHRLPSLTGLHGLEKANSVTLVNNDKLASLAGLGNIAKLGGHLTIDMHLKLATLEGLENLTHVGGRLSIMENKQLSTLRGLEGLRYAGEVDIVANSELGPDALTGLSGLESVRTAFKIRDQPALRSLEGLDSLFRVSGLKLTGLEGLESLAGLWKLNYAYGGIFIKDCPKLASLHGLGALLRTSQLFMRGVDRMNVLGGPFAAGAMIDMVDIDEAAWPRCITPHERKALVSAVANLDASSIPEATWQRWRDCCPQELVGPFTCTRGQPCSFSLVRQEPVFISGRTTGCGRCSEDHQLLKVAKDGVVDLDYALRDEEAGLRSICRCSEDPGPVAQLLLRGPRPSGVTICSRGHNCTLSMRGVSLEPTDRVVLMNDCTGGDPLSGLAASWTSEGTYLLHDPAWYAALPTRFQVCWRAPCTSAADGPSCPAPENSYFQAGELELHGPYSRSYTLVLGDHLVVANIGFGVADGNRMRLRRACGVANEDGMVARTVTSSSMLYDFGRLTEDRIEAGRHRLCWCGEHNGTACDAEEHFRAEAGDVEILCPAGQELVSSRHCRECPAGRQRVGAELGPCSDCPVGQFAQGGKACAACEAGSFAERVGSSVCTACRPWESADAEAAGCSTNPGMVMLLACFLLAVCGFCALLMHFLFRRRLPVMDVSLDQGHITVSTLGPHGLQNFGCHSFPVILEGTGCPALDSPSKPLRATVRDTLRLELLIPKGGSVDSRLDTSQGTLRVAFPRGLYHPGWLWPRAFNLLALLMVVAALSGPVLDADMGAEALLGVSAVVLASIAASVALWLRPTVTPLAARLSEFRLQLAKQAESSRCDKGPDRAIRVGKLYELLDFFRDFICDRDAYYLNSNILTPLTKPSRLSYAELVGAGPVQWFVSHFWGTAFEHLCTALRKHAETSCGPCTDWSEVFYWVCFCSNNQHDLGEELGCGWEESSFYITLKSGQCRGTCMVLDDQALPLTRLWCIFELLQTVKLERSSENFQGLLLCTSSGLLNTGSGSVEVAMALAKRVVGMDLATAQATRDKDARMIREQVVHEMGSFDVLNQFVRHELRDMLVRAQYNSNQQFATVLALLEENPQEVTTLAL